MGVGAHQAAPSGSDANVNNSCHGIHPWNPPCPPEVHPLPLIFTTRLLSRFYYLS